MLGDATEAATSRNLGSRCLKTYHFHGSYFRDDIVAASLKHSLEGRNTVSAEGCGCR